MLKSEAEMTKTTTKKAVSSPTARKKSASTTRSKKSASAAAPTPLVAAALPEKAAARPHPSRDDIARRAYELYLARGASGGSATEDWLRAERELGNGKGRAQDAVPSKR